jgi:hypothetical protein
MAVDLEKLKSIYTSRGPDGLNRSDRQRNSNYSKREFLFENFLNNRKKEPNLQLKHEHILRNYSIFP